MKATHIKVLKYLGSLICILLIIGTLPSIGLIISGLNAGRVDDASYFVIKLIIYLLVVILLAVVSWMLFRSARIKEKDLS